VSWFCFVTSALLSWLFSGKEGLLFTPDVTAAIKKAIKIIFFHGFVMTGINKMDVLQRPLARRAFENKYLAIAVVSLFSSVKFFLVLFQLERLK
jgi:hypothetical protein